MHTDRFARKAVDVIAQHILCRSLVYDSVPSGRVARKQVTMINTAYALVKILSAHVLNNFLAYNSGGDDFYVKPRDSTWRDRFA